MRKFQIVVIGGSDEHEYSDEAWQIGKAIAENGAVCVTGGRGGVMESVSKGADAAGGFVIGIVPDDSLDAANPYCSAVIATGMGWGRNYINVLSADLIVAIGGKAGTLNELSYAWALNVPVVACTFAGGWGQWIASNRIDSRKGSDVFVAASVEETVEYITRLVSGSQ